MLYFLHKTQQEDIQYWVEGIETCFEIHLKLSYELWIRVKNIVLGYRNCFHRYFPNLTCNLKSPFMHAIKSNCMQSLHAQMLTCMLAWKNACILVWTVEKMSDKNITFCSRYFLTLLRRAWLINVVPCYVVAYCVLPYLKTCFL